MHTDLVYALEPLINGGNLSFLPRQYAQERAQEIEALLAVTTWGQAKALNLTHLGDRFEDEIADAEPYTLREDPALADGDFPAMVSQWALDNLFFPPEVFVRIGTVKHTIFNGPFLAIDPDREAEVVTILREAGYHVERDDRLVLSCGYLPEDVQTSLEQIQDRSQVSQRHAHEGAARSPLPRCVGGCRARHVSRTLVRLVDVSR